MNILISHLIAGYIKGEPAIKIPHLELTNEDKVVFIKGSNGSGKTSFLKVFYNGIRTIEGQVLIDQNELNEKTRTNWLSKIGICLHNGLSYNHLSVEENKRLISYLYPPAPHDYRSLLFNSLNLAEISTKKANELSVGQRKRLDLFLAMQHMPQLVLLDEPTSNLDSENAALIHSIIRDYSQYNNMQFIIASNNENEIALFDTKVVQITNGEILVN
ncbi:ATP-binding cassette domain-containing protein [Aquirufa sp. A-Brett2-W8]|jgi:ABC-type multidrug transport system ATPase subunit